MNPAKWLREHQIALAIAVIMGVALGVVVGFAIQAAGSGAEGGYSFKYWISHPFRLGGFWWGLFGALIAAGLIHVRRLTSTRENGQ